jgi:hypothetical protein
MDLATVLREFGFPIALCVVLLYAIRHMAAQLVKAYTDRIATLEGIVRSLTKKVDELEADRLRRADEYAHGLKAVAERAGEQAREFTRTIRELLPLLRSLVEAVNARPCQMQDYRPHAAPPPRGPIVSDVPRSPAERETDKAYKHG